MSGLDHRKAGRYLRTVSHLRPEQIAHRLRLRAQQSALRRWPKPFEQRWLHAGGTPNWPEAFVAIDALVPPDCGPIDELEEGRFTFLNETLALGNPVAWDPPGASQLWLYHQHYWEWTWTLLNDVDRDRARAIFERQLRSWIGATRFGRWNAWAPYPASLRTWVFVNVESQLVQGTRLQQTFHQLLGLHAGFVEHNLELDVGGNHLLKNLKALVGLGVFFDDARLVEKAAGLLGRQLTVQVLPDGGHFELSPSYHCQVLGDLLDIGALMEADGRPSVDGIDDAIARMRTWLGVMVMPDGDVPLFNDCERVGRDRVRALQPAPRPEQPLTVLSDSGYVVANPGERIHLVADVGAPCPPDLPAHAQADCLTFELAIDGHRTVVDPGTSVYGSARQRQWERSTRAHSTVTIDGTDQTEVWGSFRAGRLAEATLDMARTEGDALDIRAHHDGYRHLPGSPVHHRRWLVTPDRIEITDQVEGREVHSVALRVLLDSAQVRGVSDGEVECTGCRISVEAPEVPGEGSAVQVNPAEYATGHGELRDALAIEGQWTVDLPARLVTTIDLTSAE